jgi:hypothetical protein
MRSYSIQTMVSGTVPLRPRHLRSRRTPDPGRCRPIAVPGPKMLIPPLLHILSILSTLSGDESQESVGGCGITGSAEPLND